MKLMMVLLAMGLVELAGWQEAQKPAEEKTTGETKTGDAGKLVNPVKATAESIALGKKAYGTDCAMCHGPDGSGNGDLASAMKLKLKDYRDPAALKEMADGEMFEIIMNGKGQMTGEEGRMKAPQIWNLVNYVRSLGKAKPL